MQKSKIILLGPPGAGKGTQAKALSKELGLVHISTGDILRQAIKNNTTLGVQAKSYVEAGELVPDSLVTKIVIQRLSEPDIRRGFILDGFPRNLKQAEDLDSLLTQGRSGDSIRVIYLDASAKTLIQRLSGRRICRNCQAVFHITNMPAKKNMICDFCAGPLYQRKDDEPATIKNRLEVYKQQTMALVDYYTKRKRLISISADEDAGVVLEKMLRELSRVDDPY